MGIITIHTVTLMLTSIQWYAGPGEIPIPLSLVVMSADALHQFLLYNS